MKIKITSCSDSLFWYNSCIGEEFIICKIEYDRYWTREKDGYLNFVLTKDCQLLED